MEYAVPENNSPKSYKISTIQTYDATVERNVKGFDEYFEICARAEADHFMTRVKPAGLILDLGCGGGPASWHFEQHGYRTISGDLSQKMLQVCQERGLSNLVQLDLEKLPIAQKSLAAVWAHTSLLHIPKSRLSTALENIAKILKPNGKLFVALKLGQGEGFTNRMGGEMWFSNFERGEFESNIPEPLELIRHTETQYQGVVFLNYQITKTI